VRRATADDRGRAIRTSVRAFVGDPLIRWFFPHDDEYEHDAATFFGMLFDLRIDAGEVWCTDDVVAVAMWDTPTTEPGPRSGSDLWETVVATLPTDTRARLERLGRTMGPHHFPEPHWYLGILATHPDWQRQGLGVSVMAPALAKADAGGLPCVLLTESPENVAFYRARGFGVIAEPKLDGGPHLWFMRREAGVGSL
jgi:GNAT superfamily N-acetyltransferase